MCEILQAIDVLIKVFRKYAEKDGDQRCLSKAELKDLLDNELRGFLKGDDEKKKLDDLFKDLDENKDNSVDFYEYGCFILTIATVMHGYVLKK
ncbi:protein S100-P-like [Brachionichthys hirsutus]|uniref:protein S100-P-like n=1 Tax=Brachionichthys hirsutus TaxID=412623 RepID=UPI003604B45C